MQMSPAACSVILQKQWQVSDTAFRGTQVMAEPHWLQSGAPQGWAGFDPKFQAHLVQPCLLWLPRDAEDLS